MDIMFEEPIIDVTGTPLTPSRQGKKCLGNGKHPEYEWCCDECDYFLYCFAQYYFKFKLKRTYIKKRYKITKKELSK